MSYRPPENLRDNDQNSDNIVQAILRGNWGPFFAMLTLRHYVDKMPFPRDHVTKSQELTDASNNNLDQTSRL